MTKEEMLDHFALHILQAQIAKDGIPNYFASAQKSYQMAIEMIEHRDRIHVEWKRIEDQQQQHKIADLHELNLPIRCFRCLQAEDIHTKERLCEWTERELRKIPNLGLKGVRSVKEAMAAANLKLKGQE
jgi:DNA-directed RNA polymerase alpha subunit